MSPVIIQADQVVPQAWRNGGGQTRELLAWPTAADWKLRISRADIEASGPFSAFAGVQRWFVVLSGRGVVLHMPSPDGRTQDHALQPGHAPLHFDGGLAPGCTLIDGPTQDLNLMVRGGDACVLPVVAGLDWSAAYAMRGIYTACDGIWTDGQETIALAAHSLLWLPQTTPTASTPTTMRFSSDSTNPPQAWWLGYTPETSA